MFAKDGTLLVSTGDGVANKDGIIHLNQVINGNKNNKIPVRENKNQNPGQINNSLTINIKKYSTLA